jgi:tRNA(Ile)-lysidine synthetase-like protein
LTNPRRNGSEIYNLATYSNNLEGLWSLAHHKIRSFSLENQRFAIGVSGGADSIALFHVFLDFLKKNIISDLVVFHINFGLRGEESDGDERFVRSVCSDANIKCSVHRPSEPISESIQEAARGIRLDIQSELRRQGFVIALAHNADDVTETALMRLCRGTAPSLAAGMTYFNGDIFRPWLDISRDMIRSALSASKKYWREDSSNISSVYTRNRIRNDVMPILNELFPGASARISRTFLHEFPADRRITGKESQCLPISVIQSETKGRINDSLHSWLSMAYGGRCPVPRQIIDQISESVLRVLTGSGESKEFHLPEAKVLKLTRSELTIYPRN